MEVVEGLLSWLASSLDLGFLLHRLLLLFLPLLSLLVLCERLVLALLLVACGRFALISLYLEQLFCAIPVETLMRRLSSSILHHIC